MRSKGLEFVLLAVLLTACGKQPAFQLESRELSAEEIHQLGYDRESAPEESQAYGYNGEQDQNSFPFYALKSLPEELVLSNAIGGVIQKIISPGDSRLAATLIGQALPPGVEAFALNGGKSTFHVYEKKLKSTLGFNILNLHYKIGYHYGAKYRGKGSYIANVKFIPLVVSTDPLWSISATSLSEEPENIGSASDPVAKLGFAVTFNFHGVGTRVVTDEFVLEGNKGKLKETVREFAD